MVPESLLPFSVRDGLALPHYLAERDHPWIRALADEYERFVGRPRRELDERLEEPLPCAAPSGKLHLARHVLDGLFGAAAESSIPPPRARAAVFAAATRETDASVALAGAALDLGVTTEALRESLFADLPGERRIASPSSAASPSEIGLRANLLLVQALLYRSTRVEIEAEGNARAHVRHVKLRGLIATVAPRPAAGDALLAVSGPFALFRRTLLYGRALAELVPLLGWCDRHRLRAECILRGRPLRLELRSGDPVFPAPAPQRFDSRLEERFARDFGRIAPEWDVVREPEPVEAAGTLIFPDFALVHRRDPARRWLLELAGFWTPDYVAQKLARLRAARLRNPLIVCLDDDRNCGEAELPAGAHVIRFRRRLDAAVVLRCVEPDVQALGRATSFRVRNA